MASVSQDILRFSESVKSCESQLKNIRCRQDEIDSMINILVNSTSIDFPFDSFEKFEVVEQVVNLQELPSRALLVRVFRTFLKEKFDERDFDQIVLTYFQTFSTLQSMVASKDIPSIISMLELVESNLTVVEEEPKSLSLKQSKSKSKDVSFEDVKRFEEEDKKSDEEFKMIEDEIKRKEEETQNTLRADRLKKIEKEASSKSKDQPDKKPKEIIKITDEQYIGSEDRAHSFEKEESKIFKDGAKKRPVPRKSEDSSKRLSSVAQTSKENFRQIDEEAEPVTARLVDLDSQVEADFPPILSSREAIQVSSTENAQHERPSSTHLKPIERSSLKPQAARQMKTRSSGSFSKQKTKSSIPLLSDRSIPVLSQFQKKQVKTSKGSGSIGEIRFRKELAQRKLSVEKLMRTHTKRSQHNSCHSLELQEPSSLTQQLPAKDSLLGSLPINPKLSNKIIIASSMIATSKPENSYCPPPKPLYSHRKIEDMCKLATSSLAMSISDPKPPQQDSRIEDTANQPGIKTFNLPPQSPTSVNKSHQSPVDFIVTPEDSPRSQAENRESKICSSPKNSEPPKRLTSLPSESRLTPKFSKIKSKTSLYLSEKPSAPLIQKTSSAKRLPQTKIKPNIPFIKNLIKDAESIHAEQPLHSSSSIHIHRKSLKRHSMDNSLPASQNSKFNSLLITYSNRRQTSDNISRVRDIDRRLHPIGSNRESHTLLANVKDVKVSQRLNFKEPSQEFTHREDLVQNRAWKRPSSEDRNDKMAHSSAHQRHSVARESSFALLQQEIASRARQPPEKPHVSSNLFPI